MDLFIILRDLVITISNNLPPALTNFILRLGILLVLSTILLASAWLYLPNKSIFSQTAVGFFAFVISLYLPVERVREAGEGVLAFTVIVSFLCIVFLPEWLPAFLVPRYGDRLKLKKVLKWTIWLLFLVQVIIGVISDG